MSDNLLDAAIARRNTEQPVAVPQQYSTSLDKLNNLAAASALKAAKLTAMATQARANQLSDDNSWAGKVVGKDTEGFTGTSINIGAKVAERVSQIAGSAMKAPVITSITSDIENIPDDVRAAWARKTSGTASPEDLALLQQAMPQPRTPEQSVYNSDGLGDNFGVPIPNVVGKENPAPTRTYQEGIESVNARIAQLKDISDKTDMSGIVHRERERELQRQISGNFHEPWEQTKAGFKSMLNGSPISGAVDTLGGVGKIAASVANAAFDNPVASVEAISGVVPDIALGARFGTAGIAASTVPYAIDEFFKGIVAHGVDTNGALPSNEELSNKKLMAGTLAAAEFASDKMMLGVKSAANAVKKAVPKATTAPVVAGAAEEVAKSTSRDTFKKALGVTANVLTNSSLGRVASNATRAGVSEYGTEAYQTYAEEDIQGKEADAATIHLGGAMGAIAGGGMGGARQLGRESAVFSLEAAKAVRERLANKRAGIAAPMNAKEKAAFDEAVAANDTTIYEDKTSKSYNPARALTVLHEVNKLDSTTPEMRKDNEKKAASIVSSIGDELAKSNAVLAAAKALTPEVMEKKKATLAMLQEKLLTEPDTTSKRYATIAKGIANLEKDVASADPKNIRIQEANIAAMERSYKDVAERQIVLMEETKNAKRIKDLEESIGVINEPADADPVVEATKAPERKKRINEVISLAMSANGGVTVEHATALLENKTNGLTTEQRQFMEAFRNSANSVQGLIDLSSVKNEILYGDPAKNQMGILQHRQSIQNARTTGDAKKLNDAMALFKNFALGHVSKAAALTKAQSLYTNTPIYVGRNAKDGTWGIVPQAVKGGNKVDSGSTRFIENVQQEADTLVAVLEEQELANAISKGTPSSAPSAPAATGKKVGFTLRGKNKYTPKDQKKADKATAFIGAGVAGSSTASYVEDAIKGGIPVNSGKYTADDVVFVSTNGKRSGRIPADLVEIGKAVAAGATILTDAVVTEFNTGEREVANFLTSKGYVNKGGTWNKATTPSTKVAPSVTQEAPSKAATPVKSELEQRIDRYVAELKNHANTSTEKLTKVASWAAKKLAEIAEALKAKNLSADRVAQLVGYKSKLESFAKSVNDILVERNKQDSKFGKKNIFSVVPRQAADKKASIKASIATQYIGFGEGIANSSTESYRQQAGEYANTGNYSSNDTIFVSVVGMRGAEAQRVAQQDRTIREALKAIKAGATLVTDNKAYVDSSSYNTGEKRLAQALLAEGHTYSEKTVDGQQLGIWTKGSSAPVSATAPTSASPAAAPAVTPTPPKPAPAIDAPTAVQPEANAPIKVERRDSITRESVRAEPETLFVFGDNDQRKGFGGQAKAMRGEPNAVSIRTKATPQTGESVYWSDAMYEDNIKKIDEDFKRIESHKGTVVIPSAGLGTGLSGLQNRAPKTLAYLESKIAALSPTVSTQATPVTSSEPVVDDAASNSNKVAEFISPAPVVPAEEEKDPTVAALTRKSPKGTPFNAKELIGEFFAQAKGSATALSRNPLTLFTDFMQKVRDKQVKLTDYLPAALQEDLGDKARAVLTQFSKFERMLTPVINGNLIKGKEEYRFKNMMQFLIENAVDEFGNSIVPTNGEQQVMLEANVITAMTYAAQRLIVDLANKKRYNDNEAINGLVGRKSYEKVSHEMQKTFGDVGMRQNNIQNRVGKDVLKALGIRAKINAPMHLQPNLESAIGALLIKSLQHQSIGLLTRTTISGAVMRDVLDNENITDRERHHFIKLVRNEDGKLSSLAQAMKDTAKGSQSVLDKLFGVKSATIDPTKEPVPFTQNTVKDGNSTIPPTLRKSLVEQNAHAYTVNPAMWHLFEKLGKTVVMQAQGMVKEEEASHVSNRLGNKAKNDALDNEYESVIGFVEDNLDVLEGAPIHFEHIVWGNFRVGIATGTVDPMTQKIARVLFAQERWTTDIDMSDAAAKNQFLIRAGEGIGVKIGNMSYRKGMTEVLKKLSNPAIKNALDAIETLTYSESLTDQELATARAKVAAGVKATGKDMHGLVSLQTLSEFMRAKRLKQKTVSLTLPDEVDGIANGPILTHALLGAANTVEQLAIIMEKGGFYKVGSTYKNFNDWAGELGNKDLYQHTMSNVMDEISAVTLDQGEDPLFANRISAIEFFTGKLQNKETKAIESAGRNFIKTPLTALFFGSALDSAVSSMAGKYIEGIFEAIEDLWAMEPGESQERRRIAVIRNINTMLESNGVALNEGMTVQELLDTNFTSYQLETLEYAFARSFGEAVKTVLKKDFANVIEARDSITETAQATYEIYAAVYKGMREAFIRELIKNKQISVDRFGNANSDLTQEQEDALRNRLKKLEPKINTQFSKEEGNPESGFSVLDSETKTSMDNNYKTAMELRDVDTGKVVKEEVRSIQRTMTGPGIGTLAGLIHSSDSANSHRASMGSQILNIHDAHVGGLRDIETIARNLNKATFDVLVSYSPTQETFHALERTVISAVALLEQENVPPEVKTYLAQALAKTIEANTEITNKNGYTYTKKQSNGPRTLQTIANRIHKLARKGNRIRYGYLATVGFVNQYGLEGGYYEVTDGERNAAKLLAENNKSLASKEFIEAFPKLFTLLDLENVADPISDRDTGDVPTEYETPFGMVGNAAVKSVPGLVKLFDGKDSLNVVSLIRYLYKTGLSKLDGTFKPTILVDQHSSSGYKDRTIFNAKSAGLTVAIATDFTTAGEKLTAKAAGKNYISFGFGDAAADGKVLAEAMKARNTHSLNVAGNGIYTLVEEGMTQDDVNRHVLAVLTEAYEKGQLKKIVSGGQTGVDIAAAVAARVLGITAVITLPKGYVQRGIDGKAVALSEEAILKQIEEGAQAIGIRESAQSAIETAPIHFTTELLFRLGQLVDKDMVIRMVRPDTPVSELKGVQLNAHAWYEEDADGKGEIYVLSPDFVNSGLTLETVLHETLHAALARIIHNIQNGIYSGKDGAKTPTDVAAIALVKELESLLAEATKYVNENAPGQYQAALSSVNEFLSWGMTNKAFQENVLMKFSVSGAVKPKSRKASNVFVKASRAFANALVKFIFPMKKEGSAIKASEEGMASFLHSVAGLTAVAAEYKGIKGGLKDRGSPISLAQSSQTQNSHTTKDVFDALPSTDANGKFPVSSDFSDELGTLLDTVVGVVNGPFGIYKNRSLQDANALPQGVLDKAIAGGFAPLAMEAQAAGIGMSMQEAFVMEQVYATTKTLMVSDKGATFAGIRMLQDSYVRAQKFLKPGNDADTNALIEFVFGQDAGTNPADYLSRFVALSLAHEGFNKLMATVPKTDAKQGGKLSMLNSLRNNLEDSLNWLNGKMTNTSVKQNMPETVAALVKHLARIDQKSQERIKNLGKSDFMELFENGTDKLVELVRTKVAKVADYARRSSPEALAPVAMLGAVVSIVSQGRSDAVLEQALKLRDEHFKSSQGVIAGLVNELRRPGQAIGSLFRLTKDIERQRNRMISFTTKVVLSGFANEGANLELKQKSAVTQAFLRSGAYSLLGHMDMQQLAETLENKAERDSRIANLESQLDAYGQIAIWFKNATEALGYHMATEIAGNAHVMQNTHVIANFDPMGKVNLTEAQRTDAIAIMDKLATLHAINNLDGGVLSEAAKVLREEMARTDDQGNGVEALMMQHKMLAERSLDTLFNNDPTQMVQGYIPGIYNPYTDIVATDDRAEAIELKEKGYERVSKMLRDPADPRGTVPELYVLKDGGLPPRATGMISLTSKKMRGSSLHNGILNRNTRQGRENSTDLYNMTAAKQAAIRELYTKRVSPVNPEHAYSLPVLNNKGKVVNYRYIMNQLTKTTLLEQDMRFETILGAMAGSVFDKAGTTQQNRQVAEFLKKQYDEDYKNRPSSYLRVSPTSPDAEMRELYQLLPKETRDVLVEVWGGREIMVPAEQMLMVFGYQKYTVANAFDKAPEDRNLLEKVAVYLHSEGVKAYAIMYLKMNTDEANEYAKRGASIMRRQERAVREVVGAIKDTIVVRTTVVLWDNIVSNFTVLHAAGVSTRNMIKYTLEGIRGFREWQKDEAKLFELENRLATGYRADVPALEREIAVIRDAMKANPIKGLVDAGLMPTLVEDVSVEEDPYSFKTGFIEKVSEYTNMLNPGVRKVGEHVLMGRGTSAYKFLSAVTQGSDLVARYVLVKHLTEGQKKPATKEEAYDKASQYFVNYDIALPKWLQYTEDMGITMFTKYFLRIQHVLLELLREHPVRSLAMMALGSNTSLVSDVFDASALAHFGNNPLHTSVLQGFSAVGSIATIQGATKLID